ncbi:hypothetical protein [Mesorhizobium sp. 128a]
MLPLTQDEIAAAAQVIKEGHRAVWEAIATRAVYSTHSGRAWQNSRTFETRQQKFEHDIIASLASTQFARQIAEDRSALTDLIDGLVEEARKSAAEIAAARRVATDEELDLAILALKEAGPDIWDRIKRLVLLGPEGDFTDEFYELFDIKESVFNGLPFFTDDDRKRGIPTKILAPIVNKIALAEAIQDRDLAKKMQVRDLGK